MTDGHQFTRIRLEEVLGEVKTLDKELPEPISMQPSIENIETTIELFERVDSPSASVTEPTR
ncbi:hypothetical protein [Natrinema gelatinilyticum]|uniref:hypothetical protein n=1 Tax=Natrinema gelatinilyticum TaxID=2961571 RepID=UPI0020C478F2|nr:hypothetical protein [Natrinema gelatinilyticum]